MRVYLCGPMRGITDLNYPLFDSTSKILRGLGHTVFSPADMDRGLGYSENALEPMQASSALKHVIQGDVLAIINSDALVLLPNWESSMGATLEVALAQFLSLPIYQLKRVCVEVMNVSSFTYELVEMAIPIKPYRLTYESIIEYADKQIALTLGKATEN